MVEYTPEEINLNDIPFTYYGDLLGVSDFYKISESAAYNVLNNFYNMTYEAFRGIHEDVTITLFSDSIFVTGNRLKDTLNVLSGLYINLLKKQIYLKGAVAEGRLEFQPRLVYENLEKRLPTSDILYRAVILEKNIDGVRLIVEKKLAQKILPEIMYGPFYNLVDPKIIEICKQHPDSEILIKLHWNPDANAYDYYWFINEQEHISIKNILYLINIGRKFASKKAQIHYEETINFIENACYHVDTSELDKKAKH